MREDACLRLYKKVERGLKKDSVTGQGLPTGATGIPEGPSAAVSVAKGLPPPHPGPPSQTAAEVAPMLGLAKGLDFGLQALRSAKLPSFGSLANLNNLNLSWFAKEVSIFIHGCCSRRHTTPRMTGNHPAVLRVDRRLLIPDGLPTCWPSHFMTSCNLCLPGCWSHRGTLRWLSMPEDVWKILGKE